MKKYLSLIITLAAYFYDSKDCLMTMIGHEKSPFSYPPPKKKNNTVDSLLTGPNGTWGKPVKRNSG